MLQQHRRGQRIDVTLAPLGRATEFADGTQRGGSGEAFVDIPNRRTGPFTDRSAHQTHLGATRCFVAISVEGEPQHYFVCLERDHASDEFGDGGTFACASQDVPGGGGNGARRVADGQTNAPLPVVNGQYSSGGNSVHPALLVPLVLPVPLMLLPLTLRHLHEELTIRL